jgi:hypothetical protein
MAFAKKWRVPNQKLSTAENAEKTGVRRENQIQQLSYCLGIRIALRSLRLKAFTRLPDRCEPRFDFFRCPWHRSLDS